LPKLVSEIQRKRMGNKLSTDTDPMGNVCRSEQQQVKGTQPVIETQKVVSASSTNKPLKPRRQSKPSKPDDEAKDSNVDGVEGYI
jgi:hypothetical protein